MISVVFGPGDAAGPIVMAALVRSFTAAQVQVADDGVDTEFLVAINPAGAAARLAGRVAARGGKVLLLGRLDPVAAALAGVAPTPMPADLADWATCPPAPTHGATASAGVIRYAGHGLAAAFAFRARPLLRYDFIDEWNNLGYGRVGAGGSIWDLAQGARPDGAEVIAEITREGEDSLPFTTVCDRPSGGSVLWINRAVGTIDSLEWVVVEAFFSDHRAADLPCLPHLREVPYGLGAVVSMRLDCDENIKSARPLFDLYRRRGVPFSLAVKTGQPTTREDFALLREIAAAGGAILSHSVNHYARWGNDPRTAFREATESKQWLEEHLPGIRVRHVVSPFHQTPVFVPPQLAAVGYEGFIGGVISAEPNHILARGGVVPGVDFPFVSHAQQCMLHGDCLLTADDPLAIYKQAFAASVAASAIFGFLDHPFSSRYSYGWQDEEQRLAAHTAFLDHMEAVAAPAGGIWFVNEDECLDLVRRRMACRLTRADDGFRLDGPAAGPQLAVRWRGQTLPATGKTA